MQSDGETLPHRYPTLHKRRPLRESVWEVFGSCALMSGTYIFFFKSYAMFLCAATTLLPCSTAALNFGSWCLSPLW